MSIFYKYIFGSHNGHDRSLVSSHEAKFVKDKHLRSKNFFEWNMEQKLPDDSGEVPNTKWSGWRFNSRPWNPLSTWPKKKQTNKKN